MWRYKYVEDTSRKNFHGAIMDISAVNQTFKEGIQQSQVRMAESLNAVNQSPSIDNMLELHDASVKLEIDVQVMNKAFEVYAEMFDSLLELGKDDHPE